MRRIWAALGFVYFWLSWPLVIVYLRVTRPRARLLISHNDTVLAVKNWHGPRTWILPGGGVGRNEDPAQAVIREIHEELGLILEPAAVQYLGLHVSSELGVMVKYHLYSLDLSSLPKLQINPWEIIAHDWLQVSELKERKSILGDSVRTWLER